MSNHSSTVVRGSLYPTIKELFYLRGGNNLGETGEVHGNECLRIDILIKK